MVVVSGGDDSAIGEMQLWAKVLWPCPSPTGPVGPIGSDPESGGQVHGNGCEGFGKVIDQRPEEDTKCLQFTRLRIRSLYRNKL